MSTQKTIPCTFLNEFESAPGSTLFNQQTVAAVLSCGLASMVFTMPVFSWITSKASEFADSKCVGFVSGSSIGLGSVLFVMDLSSSARII